MSAQPEPIAVTVTHLEMTAPPLRSPPLPLGQNVALLRAEGMPRHFYRYLMDRVGRKWHWVNALRLSDDVLDVRLSDPERQITVLYLDGSPAGFFEIWRNGAEAEVHFFGLMEHATGRGLGRWFLGSAIQSAWATKPERVTVETCTLDHPAALPLYQRMGFNPVGQRRERVTPLTQSERAEIVMRP